MSAASSCFQYGIIGGRPIVDVPLQACYVDGNSSLVPGPLFGWWIWVTLRWRGWRIGCT